MIKNHFEPEAPALQGRCSTRLSYEPIYEIENWEEYGKSKSVLDTYLVFKVKKEVIHPQVPLRIPCDDLTHLTELRFEIL